MVSLAYTVAENSAFIRRERAEEIRRIRNIRIDKSIYEIKGLIKLH